MPGARLVAVFKGGGESPRVRFLRNLTQNVTASVGQRAVLRCRVINLGKNTVSWVSLLRVMRATGCTSFKISNDVTRGQNAEVMAEATCRYFWIRTHGDNDNNTQLIFFYSHIRVFLDWPWGQNVGLGLGLGLASVLLTWPRKMCYPMQNNIGCIHFVVVSLQASLCNFRKRCRKIVGIQNFGLKASVASRP